MQCCLGPTLLSIVYLLLVLVVVVMAGWEGSCQGIPDFRPSLGMFRTQDPFIHSAPQTWTPDFQTQSGLAHYLTNPLLWKDLLDSLYFHFISHTTFSLSGHFIIYYFRYLCIQVYNSSTQQGSTSFPLWIPCQLRCSCPYSRKGSPKKN